MDHEALEHIQRDAAGVYDTEPLKESILSRRDFSKALGALILVTAGSGITAAVARNQAEHEVEAAAPSAEALPPPEPTAEVPPPAEATKVITAESLPDLGIPWLPVSVRYWGNEILAAAEAHQVDPQLVAVIMTIESGGWPEAVSRADCLGLMQIWPPTGSSLASVLGLAEGQYDLFNPATNTTFGALNLRQLLNLYQPPGETVPSDHTVQLVAVGYNGGVGRVKNLLAGKPIPHETEVYSNYAVEIWQQRHQPTSPAFERWYSPNHGNGNILITKAHEYFAAHDIHFDKPL